ncbi:MAG: periplasmic heavy metal sensor [bacterium]|nr:periplasmic heavy metal sensor [bacterium]
MKEVFVGLLALIMLAPTAALAQEETETQGPPPGVHAAHNQVVRFLQLTEEQAAEWRNIYEIHREEEQPIQWDIAEIQAQLDELFELEDPDPAEVGALVLQRRDLGETLLEIHLIYHEDFVALLDEDQYGRLGFIHRADDVQAIIPAFKLFELIPRR